MAGEIFISYRRADAAWAQLLHSQLRAEGIEAWYDAQVGAGQDWRIATARALESSQIFVLLFSENAAESSDIAKELAAATLEKKLIIPVRLQNIAPKGAFLYELASRNWVNAYEDTEARLAQLAKGLAHLVRTGARDESVLPFERGGTQIPAQTRKRTHASALIAAVAVLVIAVSGIAAWLLWRSPRPAVAARAQTTSQDAAQKAESATPVFSPPAHSVAVLPFVNMSEDKNNEYFSDGLSEELIDLLTKVPGLQIPARTSSFYFKGRQATIAEIAKALGVAHVLEGSVRKSGNTLRITAQLIRVDNGYHVWSETFDREQTDIFKVQDEIAQSVVLALKVSLLEGTMPKAKLTTNTEAYDLYLQAQSISRGGATSDFQLATQYLQQAVTLDDKFAAAWDALALMLVRDLNWHSATPYQEFCARAHKAANKALELEPVQSEGHRVNGYLLWVCDWDWNAAEAEFKRALELDPGNSSALNSYAHLAWLLNRSEQARQLAQQAVSRDPLNFGSYLTLAFAQGTEGSFAAAEESYRQALALNPTGAGMHAFLAHALVAAHKPAEALREAESERDEEFRHMAMQVAMEALGRKGDADRELAILESKFGDNEPETIGAIYACRGEFDEAMRWLERAFSEHLLISGDVPPRAECLTNLEADPRYRALLRKMGLPG